MFLLKIVEISIFGYFFYISTYNFILSIAGCFQVRKKETENKKVNKIGILIPAYKEDNVILYTAEAATKQNFPSEFFEVIVIADSLRSDTLAKLKRLPVKIIEVSFAQSTKVKSLRSAFNYSQDIFDFLVILDADNLMRKNFLEEANKAYNAGEKIVQGRRIAKNQDSAMAVLDDLSEQINNHINRKGSNNLRWSSSIAGSGFFIDQKIGFKLFNLINSVGGFDKDLELALLGQKIKTKYYESMIVYDEKVGSSSTFKNQRKRWISSQYNCLKNYFGKGVYELLFKINISYFNSAILRNVQLPRLLNLGIFSCVGILVLAFKSMLEIHFLYWLFLYWLFLCSFFISIPKYHYNRRTLFSILKIPEIFLTMLLLLFKLKGANRNYIHTPHTINELSENE